MRCWQTVWLLILGSIHGLEPLHAQPTNRAGDQTSQLPNNSVLQLDGNNSYIDLPPNIFNDLDEATIEAWVKWQRVGAVGWNRVFNYGSAGHDLTIGTSGSNSLWFVVVDPKQGLQQVTIPGVVKIDEWIHVAAVSGKGGMRVYVNGRLAGQNPYPGSFSALKSGELNRLGKTVTQNDADPSFQGQLDEVRIWKVARTEQEIQGAMSKKLSGQEPGLAGLWNFDDPANPGRDASPGAHHGRLAGQGQTVASSRAVMASPPAGFENALTLTGNGNYLELPEEVFQGLKEATLECWVKWRTFKGNEHVFEFDAAKRVKVGNKTGTPDLESQAASVSGDVTANSQWPANASDTKQSLIASDITDKPPVGSDDTDKSRAVEPSDIIVQPSALGLDQWHHLAVAFDGSGTRLYLDGTLIGIAPYTNGIGTVSGPGRH